MRKSWLTRRVCLLTTLVFSITSVDSHVYAGQAPPLPASVPANLPENLSSVNVPEDLGSVEDVLQQRESAKTFIIIQDAHAIPDAQRNIERLIAHFENQYGARLTGLEGAASRLDTQLLRSYPKQDNLRRLFDRYYASGELSGPSAAAVFSETGGLYHGVEDWALYEKGLALFIAAMKNEAGQSEKIRLIRARLDDQKRKAYSKELLGIDEAEDNFHRNKINLLEFIRLLARFKAPPAGSEIALMLERGASSPTSSSDYEVKQIAKEIEAFLKAQANSPGLKADMIGFYEKLQQFRTSELEAAAFALYLQELSRRHRIALKASGSLTFQMKEQKRIQEIEGTKFFEDLKAYAAQVKEGLIRNPEERELDQRTAEIRLLEKAARLELTRKEWAELKLRGPALFYKYPELDLERPARFYENAEARDGAFLRNLAGLMEKQKQNVSILVSGGFHAQGLCERLKARGENYVLVMPRIAALPEENHYREHMKGEVSWKSYFKAEDGRINLYKAFMRNARDELLSLEEAPKGNMLKLWRDEIIRGLSAENRLDEAGTYTSYIDEAAGTGKESEEKLEKIDLFIEKVRELEAAGKLNPQSVLQLLKPSGIVPAPTGAAAFAPADSASMTVIFGAGDAVEDFRVETKEALPLSVSSGDEGSRPLSELRAEDSPEMEDFGEMPVEANARILDEIGRELGPVEESFKTRSWADFTADLETGFAAFYILRRKLQSGIEVSLLTDEQAAVYEAFLERIEALEEKISEAIPEISESPGTESHDFWAFQTEEDLDSISAGIEEGRGEWMVERDGIRILQAMVRLEVFEAGLELIESSGLAAESLRAGRLIEEISEIRWGLIDKLETLRGPRSELRSGDETPWEGYEYHDRIVPIVESRLESEGYYFETEWGQHIAVVDQHNRVVPAWRRGHVIGLIPRDASLLHIDTHPDDLFRNKSLQGIVPLPDDESIASMTKTEKESYIGEVTEKIETHYNIASFIPAEMLAGMISGKRWYWLTHWPFRSEHASRQEAPAQTIRITEEKFRWSGHSGFNKNSTKDDGLRSLLELTYARDKALDSAFPEGPIDIIDWDVDLFMSDFQNNYSGFQFLKSIMTESEKKTEEQLRDEILDAHPWRDEMPLDSEAYAAMAMDFIKSYKEILAREGKEGVWELIKHDLPAMLTVNSRLDDILPRLVPILARAKLLTIATSPGYMSQQSAVILTNAVLKSLERYKKDQKNRIVLSEENQLPALPKPPQWKDDRSQKDLFEEAAYEAVPAIYFSEAERAADALYSYEDLIESLRSSPKDVDHPALAEFLRTEHPRSLVYARLAQAAVRGVYEEGPGRDWKRKSQIALAVLFGLYRNNHSIPSEERIRLLNFFYYFPGKREVSISDWVKEGAAAGREFFENPLPQALTGRAFRPREGAYASDRTEPLDYQTAARGREFSFRSEGKTVMYLAGERYEFSDDGALLKFRAARDPARNLQPELAELSRVLQAIRKKILDAYFSEYPELEKEFEKRLNSVHGIRPHVLQEIKEAIIERKLAVESDVLFGKTASLEASLQRGSELFTNLVQMRNDSAAAYHGTTRSRASRRGEIQAASKDLQTSSVNIYVSGRHTKARVQDAIHLAYSLNALSERVNAVIYVLDGAAQELPEIQDRGVRVRAVTKAELLQGGEHETAGLHIGLALPLDFIEEGKGIRLEFPSLEMAQQETVPDSVYHYTAPSLNLKEPSGVLFLDRSRYEAKREKDSWNAGKMGKERGRWLSQNLNAAQKKALEDVSGWRPRSFFKALLNPKIPEAQWNPSLSAWSWASWDHASDEELNYIASKASEPAFQSVLKKEGGQLLLHALALPEDFPLSKFTERGMTVITAAGEILRPEGQAVPVTVVLHPAIYGEPLKSLQNLSGTMTRDPEDRFWLDVPAFVSSDAHWLQAMSGGSLWMHSEPHAGIDAALERKKILAEPRDSRKPVSRVRWGASRDGYATGWANYSWDAATLSERTRDARQLAESWLDFNAAEDVIALLAAAGSRSELRVPEHLQEPFEELFQALPLDALRGSLRSEIEFLRSSILNNAGPYYDADQAEIIFELSLRHILNSSLAAALKNTPEAVPQNLYRFRAFVRERLGPENPIVILKSEDGSFSLPIDLKESVPAAPLTSIEIAAKLNPDKIGSQVFRAREIEYLGEGSPKESWIETPSFWTTQFREIILLLSRKHPQILFVSEGGAYSGNMTNGTDIDTYLLVSGMAPGSPEAASFLEALDADFRRLTGERGVRFRIDFIKEGKNWMKSIPEAGETEFPLRTHEAGIVVTKAGTQRLIAKAQGIVREKAVLDIETGSFIRKIGQEADTPRSELRARDAEDLVDAGRYDEFAAALDPLIGRMLDYARDSFERREGTTEFGASVFRRLTEFRESLSENVFGSNVTAAIETFDVIFDDWTEAFAMIEIIGPVARLFAASMEGHETEYEESAAEEALTGESGKAFGAIRSEIYWTYFQFDSGNHPYPPSVHVNIDPSSASAKSFKIYLGDRLFEIRTSQPGMREDLEALAGAINETGGEADDAVKTHENLAWVSGDGEITVQRKNYLSDSFEIVKISFVLEDEILQDADAYRGRLLEINRELSLALPQMPPDSEMSGSRSELRISAEDAGLFRDWAFRSPRQSAFMSFAGADGKYNFYIDFRAGREPHFVVRIPEGSAAVPYSEDPEGLKRLLELIDALTRDPSGSGAIITFGSISFLASIFMTYLFLLRADNGGLFAAAAAGFGLIQAGLVSLQLPFIRRAIMRRLLSNYVHNSPEASWTYRETDRQFTQKLKELGVMNGRTGRLARDILASSSYDNYLPTFNSSLDRFIQDGKRARVNWPNIMTVAAVTSVFLIMLPLTLPQVMLGASAVGLAAFIRDFIRAGRNGRAIRAEVEKFHKGDLSFLKSDPGWQEAMRLYPHLFGRSKDSGRSELRAPGAEGFLSDEDNRSSSELRAPGAEGFLSDEDNRSSSELRTSPQGNLGDEELFAEAGKAMEFKALIFDVIRQRFINAERFPDLRDLDPDAVNFLINTQLDLNLASLLELYARYSEIEPDLGNLKNILERSAIFENLVRESLFSDSPEIPALLTSVNDALQLFPIYLKGLKRFVRFYPETSRRFGDEQLFYDVTEMADSSLFGEEGEGGLLAPFLGRPDPDAAWAEAAVLAAGIVSRILESRGIQGEEAEALQESFLRDIENGFKSGEIAARSELRTGEQKLFGVPDPNDPYGLNKMTPQFERIAKGAFAAARNIHDGLQGEAAYVFTSGESGFIARDLFTAAWETLYPGDPLPVMIELDPKVNKRLYASDVSMELAEASLDGAVQNASGKELEEIKGSSVIMLDDYIDRGAKYRNTRDRMSRMGFTRFRFVYLAGGEQSPEDGLFIGTQESGAKGFLKLIAGYTRSSGGEESLAHQAVRKITEVIKRGEAAAGSGEETVRAELRQAQEAEEGRDSVLENLFGSFKVIRPGEIDPRVLGTGERISAAPTHLSDSVDLAKEVDLTGLVSDPSLDGQKILIVGPGMDASEIFVFMNKFRNAAEIHILDPFPGTFKNLDFHINLEIEAAKRRGVETQTRFIGHAAGVQSDLPALQDQFAFIFMANVADPRYIAPKEAAERLAGYVAPGGILVNAGRYSLAAHYPREKLNALRGQGSDLEIYGKALEGAETGLPDQDDPIGQGFFDDGDGGFSFDFGLPGGDDFLSSEDDTGLLDLTIPDMERKPRDEERDKWMERFRKAHESFRGGNYSGNSGEPMNAFELSAAGEGGKVQADIEKSLEGWVYRRPSSMRKDEVMTAKQTVLWRVSLNVRLSPELLRTLDGILGDQTTDTTLRGYYKFPSDFFGDWSKREDSVTIYVFPEIQDREKTSEELAPVREGLKETIKNVLSAAGIERFIRDTAPMKLGEPLLPGVSLVPEPTEEEMRALIDRASALDGAEGALTRALTHYFTREGTSKTLEASPGMIAAADKVLTEAEIEEPRSELRYSEEDIRAFLSKTETLYRVLQEQLKEYRELDRRLSAVFEGTRDEEELFEIPELEAWNRSQEDEDREWYGLTDALDERALLVLKIDSSILKVKMKWLDMVLNGGESEIAFVQGLAGEEMAIERKVQAIARNNPWRQRSAFLKLLSPSRQAAAVEFFDALGKISEVPEIPLGAWASISEEDYDRIDNEVLRDISTGYIPEQAHYPELYSRLLHFIVNSSIRSRYSALSAESVSFDFVLEPEAGYRINVIRRGEMVRQYYEEIPNDHPVILKMKELKIAKISFDTRFNDINSSLRHLLDDIQSSLAALPDDTVVTPGGLVETSKLYGYSWDVESYTDGYLDDHVTLVFKERSLLASSRRSELRGDSLVTSEEEVPNAAEFRTEDILGFEHPGKMEAIRSKYPDLFDAYVMASRRMLDGDLNGALEFSRLLESMRISRTHPGLDRPLRSAHVKFLDLQQGWRGFDKAGLQQALEALKLNGGPKQWLTPKNSRLIHNLGDYLDDLSGRSEEEYFASLIVILMKELGNRWEEERYAGFGGEEILFYSGRALENMLVVLSEGKLRTGRGYGFGGFPGIYFSSASSRAWQNFTKSYPAVLGFKKRMIQNGAYGLYGGEWLVGRYNGYLDPFNPVTEISLDTLKAVFFKDAGERRRFEELQRAAGVEIEVLQNTVISTGYEEIGKRNSGPTETAVSSERSELRTSSPQSILGDEDNGSSSELRSDSNESDPTERIETGRLDPGTSSPQSILGEEDNRSEEGIALNPLYEELLASSVYTRTVLSDLGSPSFEPPEAAFDMASFFSFRPGVPEKAAAAAGDRIIFVSFQPSGRGLDFFRDLIKQPDLSGYKFSAAFIQHRGKLLPYSLIMENADEKTITHIQISALSPEKDFPRLQLGPDLTRSLFHAMHDHYRRQNPKYKITGLQFLLARKKELPEHLKDRELHLIYLKEPVYEGRHEKEIVMNPRGEFHLDFMEVLRREAGFENANVGVIGTGQGDDILEILWKNPASVKANDISLTAVMVSRWNIAVARANGFISADIPVEIKHAGTLEGLEGSAFFVWNTPGIYKAEMVERSETLGLSGPEAHTLGIFALSDKVFRGFLSGLAAEFGRAPGRALFRINIDPNLEEEGFNEAAFLNEAGLEGEPAFRRHPDIWRVELKPDVRADAGLPERPQAVRESSQAGTSRSELREMAEIMFDAITAGAVETPGVRKSVEAFSAQTEVREALISELKRLKEEARADASDRGLLSFIRSKGIDLSSDEFLELIRSEIDAVTAALAEIPELDHAVGFVASEGHLPQDFLRALKETSEAMPQQIKYIVVTGEIRQARAAAAFFRAQGYRVILPSGGREIVLPGTRQQFTGMVTEGSSAGLRKTFDNGVFVGRAEGEEEDVFMKDYMTVLQIAVSMIVASEAADAVKLREIFMKPAELLKNYGLFRDFEGQILQTSGEGFEISAVAVRAYLEWKAGQAARASA